MLTPADLKNRTFSRGFRGYETEEVDKFMEELRKEYEYLYMDNLELKETIERVSSKLEYYQQMEATMQSTLTVAQETADEVKSSSEKKAALLEHETKVKCEQMLADARNAAEKLHNDTLAQAEDLYNKTKNKTENMLNATEAECSRMKEEARSYAAKLRNDTEIEIEKLRVANEDACKKRANSASAEAGKLLETARNEANRMSVEASSNYRKIVGDAEERSRKIIFEAESRAAMAQNAYDDQVKKALVHRRHMQHLLETQLELLKNFEEQTSK